MARVAKPKRPPPDPTLKSASLATDAKPAARRRKSKKKTEDGGIGPQPGPQKRFLTSRADITIYGGAAGGGKTWALLLEPMRNREIPDYAAVFFRRTTVQIRNPGGLWDESFKIYVPAGAEPFVNTLEWRFPSGAKVKFAHLEHEKSVFLCPDRRAAPARGCPKSASRPARRTALAGRRIEGRHSSLEHSVDSMRWCRRPRSASCPWRRQSRR